jgi:hypothetical protein
MQELRPEERREFQRVHLSQPIAATLGGTPVSILEIGVLGARLHHDSPLAGQHAELRLKHEGQDITLKCETVRTSPGLESGVRFLAAVGESGDRLRTMLGELVARELNARRNPTSTPFEPSVDGDRTVRAKDAGFICFRFENGKWTKRAVFLPEQPASGFTVTRSSDAEELQRLCKVYEASDEEGRRLIRVFAELGVSDVLQIPPPV